MLLKKIALLAAAFFTLDMLLTRESDKKSMLLRGYVHDQFASPDTPGFEVASRVAADVDLPLGWVIAIQQAGVPADHLAAASRAARQHFLMPTDSLPSTLARARTAAISAGVTHVQGR